ncbi:MAG: hypothetical protein JNJ59_05425 [Deltaproteobacteria bacterium]|nr:hypothetical protein [Deltaproteobacteria bacterium]
MGDTCDESCTPGAKRWVACEGCGRHVRAADEVCPFCARRAPSRLRHALVAAAFFGATTIAGCAYGPPPDDFRDTSDDAADSAGDVTGDADTSANADSDPADGDLGGADGGD